MHGVLDEVGLGQVLVAVLNRIKSRHHHICGWENFGSDGRRHSANFFELVNQPIEIMMAVTEQQVTALFEKIKITEAFFISKSRSNIPCPLAQSPIGAFFSTRVVLCVP